MLGVQVVLDEVACEVTDGDSKLDVSLACKLVEDVDIQLRGGCAAPRVSSIDLSTSRHGPTAPQQPRRPGVGNYPARLQARWIWATRPAPMHAELAKANSKQYGRRLPAQ